MRLAKRRATWDVGRRGGSFKLMSSQPFAVDTTRPSEIEDPTNRLVVHRISRALLPRAADAGLHPNLVSCLGLALGIAAAGAYWHWSSPAAVIAGFLLMVGWHVCDGLDGQLARATGRTSELGRFLDGICDYSTFVAVNLALVFSLDDWPHALAVACAAGVAHALQAAFYEAERATYLRRLAGRFEATPRSRAGGPLEALYNRAEALLGNRTRDFDGRLAAMPPAQARAAVEAWRARAAPRLSAVGLLSANNRTIAIALACLAGSPWLYWLWTLVVLSAAAILLGLRLRAAERV